MKYKPKYSRTKSRKTQRMKIGVLFVFASIIVIIASGMMAKKFFNNNETVQAIENEPTYAEDTTENDIDSLQIESNSKVEKGKFVETYLEEQRRGKMPEGADGKKVVYLTFDDGPSENVTPLILDVLKQEDVNATFFVLGKSVDTSEKTKEILKRQVDEGNSIGIHSYTHDYHHLYPDKIVNVDNFMGEVNKTQESLKKVLGDGFESKIVRLPGGHMSWKGTSPLDEKFKEEGYSFIDWNALSKDAEGPKKNADQLYEETVKSAGTKEKVVVLMHDISDKQETAKALPNVIQYFKNNGYEFKTIE